MADTAIILVTQNPQPLMMVAREAARYRRHLIIVDIGLTTMPILPTGVELTIVRLHPEDRPTLVNAVNRGIHVALKRENNVLILDDNTSHQIQNLLIIESVYITTPRVASINSGNKFILGTRAVSFNPVFGSWFHQGVFKLYGLFDPQITDIATAACKWGTRINEKGYAHIQTSESTPITEFPRTPSKKLTSLDKNQDKDLYLAPSSEFNWRGPLKKLPWQYPITVIIPHYGTNFRLLRIVVELWRSQKIKPYFQIFDTGTPKQYHPELLTFESMDSEVHFCRWHGQKNPWDCVANVYQHALIDSRSNKLLYTHNDILPMTQDILGELSSLCSANQPVVGYSSWTNPLNIGTTLTMVHVPTLDKLRTTWSMRWYSELALSSSEKEIFPEMAFNESLIQAGVIPKIIGREENRDRQITPHFDHVRSQTVTSLYNQSYYAKLTALSDEAIVDAESRLVSWREF